MNSKNRSKPKKNYLKLGINGKHHFCWTIPYTLHKPKLHKKTNKRTKDINPKNNSPIIVVITTWKMMNNKRIKEVMNNRNTKEMMSNNRTKGTIEQLKKQWTTRGWPSKHYVMWGPRAQWTRKWQGKWWAIKGPKKLIGRKLPSPPPLLPPLLSPLPFLHKPSPWYKNQKMSTMNNNKMTKEIMNNTKIKRRWTTWWSHAKYTT